MIRVFSRATVPVMDIIELQGNIVIADDALVAARAAQERRRSERLAARRSGAADLVALTEDGDASSSGAHTASTHTSVVGSSATTPAGPVRDAAPTSSCDSNSDAEEEEEEDDGDEGPGATSTSSAAAGSPVVEVLVGRVEQDRLSESRGTLCIDTLRVHGRRSSLRHPWLVLRECTPARTRTLRRQAMAHARQRADGDVACLQTAVAVAAQSDTSATTTLFSDWLRAHPEALRLDSLFLDDATTDEDGEASGSGDSDGATTNTNTTTTAAGRKRARTLDGTEGRGGPERVPPRTSAVEYKTYELVGIVRGASLFNSKPARVFA
ncbi:hypothetical protein NESM_000209300 [Novymonas esmeraldas]|uniref:Uncharacterized protein n=1 Tax=Novymonas esmeraldas TaxID=1808958 RepID=A0AAW0F5B9_9TRYP